MTQRRAHTGIHAEYPIANSAPGECGYHRPHHVASHAAWICAQLNRKVTWDPAKRMFLNDEEANRMRSRAYREPWRMEALATNM
jgi:hypothetical protein